MNKETVVAYQDETISHICYRIFGNSKNMVEKVLQANPGLCELPVNLPAGTVITLPQVVIQTNQKSQIIKNVNLWD